MFHVLSLAKQEMLTDFVFNLGTLKSFPKFVRAVLTNNNVAIEKEYKRYSAHKELTQRNEMFFNRYIKK